MNRRSRNERNRRGVAAVELTVCLPILFIISLATVEVCGMLHMGQTLKIASFEAARVGVVPGSTIENIEYQCQSLLDSRRVKGYSISMEPSNPALLEEGDYFRVTIDVNYNKNALVGGFLGRDRTITRSTALRVD